MAGLLTQLASVGRCGVEGLWERGVGVLCWCWRQGCSPYCVGERQQANRDLKVKTNLFCVAGVKICVPEVNIAPALG